MTTTRGFQTKNQYVEDSLREAIARGELRPGMWIRSEEWAARLNTSLTPIREALRTLEADGLLQIYPHRGARVISVSRSEFEELSQMRAALEGLGAERAVRQMDASDAAELVAELEDLQEQIKGAIAGGQLARLRELNGEFHAAIFARGENLRLCRLIENLRMAFPWDTLALSPGRPPNTIAEHEAIIEAIRCRDADAAREAMSFHIATSTNALLQAEAELGLRIFEDEATRHAG